MAAAIQENIPPPNESKSSKKKKSKVGVSSPASAPSQVQEEAKEEHVNGESSSENPYLKEINKNIRNLKKKIAASSKVESILAENKGKSIDDLLATRTINADQKAQLDKKPTLLTQLEQYESQYQQYKKLDEEYQEKLKSEKESFLASHGEELEKIKASVRAEVEAEQKTLFTEKLLTFSRFLRTAAAKRSDEENQEDDDAAFEGVLLLVYGGDLPAVRAIEKLIDGDEEIIPGVDGEETNFSFKHVRDVSQKQSPPIQSDDTIEPPTEVLATDQIGTDPTVANAGLTELDNNATITNGDSAETESSAVPSAAIVEPGTANEVAEAHWEAKLPQSVTSGPNGFESVENQETENKSGAASIGPTGASSWAEDIPTEAPIIPSTAPPDDGFHEVSHHRAGRSRGNNGGQTDWRGSRGGRGRGDGRGRGGFRGDGGRGRGRGGPQRAGERGRGRGDSTKQ